MPAVGAGPSAAAAIGPGNSETSTSSWLHRSNSGPRMLPPIMPKLAPQPAPALPPWNTSGPLSCHSVHLPYKSSASARGVPEVVALRVDPQRSKAPLTLKSCTNVIGKRKVRVEKSSGPRPPRKRKCPDPPISKVRWNIDVWNVIFSFCDPSDLRRLRLVSSDFGALLEYNGVWKLSRLNKYGESMPDPPPGIKESQYLDLVDGSSCMSCSRKQTRKAYWPFLRRWCDQCFHAQIIPEDKARPLLDARHKDLKDCIASAKMDHWNSYDGTWRRPDPEAMNFRRPGIVRIFSRSDVDDICAEFDEYAASHGTMPAHTASDDHLSDSDAPDSGVPNAVNDWIRSKKAAMQTFLSHTRKIEQWEKRMSRDRSQTHTKNKKSRETYFQEKAQKMDPPLAPKALRLISAYQRAIAIAKSPSEKAWVSLQKKILEARGKAEEMARYEEEAQAQDYWYMLRRYEPLMPRSYMMYPRPDGTGEATRSEFILALAEEAIHVVDREAWVDGVTFTLKVLHETWKRYQKIPLRGRPPCPLADSPLFRNKGPNGTYALSIRDAQMVYAAKIEPFLKSIPHQSLAMPGSFTKRFRCPGCTRSGCKGLFNFDAIFLHIHSMHASSADGDFSSFRLAGGRTIPAPSFIAVPWTRNLPVLTPDAHATGRWDPHADPEGVVEEEE